MGLPEVLVIFPGQFGLGNSLGVGGWLIERL